MKQLKFSLTILFIFSLTSTITTHAQSDSINTISESVPSLTNDPALKKAPKDTVAENEENPAESDGFKNHEDYHEDYYEEDAQYESPLLLAFGIFAIALCLFTFISGLVISAAIIILIVLLTIAGVISTSVIVGLRKKSFSKGFSTFIILSSAVFGIGTSALIGSIRNHFFEHLDSFQNLDSYIAIGAITGLTLGFTIMKLFKKTFEFLKRKYNQFNW